MRTRIAAGIAVLAVGLGIFSVVVLALGYFATVVNPPDDSGVANASWTRPAVAAKPTPSPSLDADPLALAQPTVADIPDSFSAEEVANWTSWIAMQEFVDQCMADAGYPQYTYSAYWQEGADPYGTDWTEGMTDSAKAEAFDAEWGSTHAGGADYRWEDAGCAGYGTHMIGADNAN